MKRKRKPLPVRAPMLTPKSAMIAYWGDDKSVAFVVLSGNAADAPLGTLHGRMEDRLLNGHVTEILEYWPHFDDSFAGHLNSYRVLADKCNQWKRQLRELGYEVAD